MVKSVSCFFCGGDKTLNEDGFEPIESKRSTEKRWSFRKKADRHRVLGNTAISEGSSPGNRENPEATNIDFNEHTGSTIAEKTYASQTNEVIPFSTEVNSNVPEMLVLTENDCKIDPIISKETENACKIDPIISKETLIDTGSVNIMKDPPNIDFEVEESSAIVIQAAMRGYLSRKALLKIKNVVKLQAAVRGHLVRNQAVGTLRCVQAIAKMQALVRAHRDQNSLKGSTTNVKLAAGSGTSKPNIKPMGKANPSFFCAEKILENSFARQLLESTPKNKPIHIKCDPLTPDSAWIWLGRWMSASSPDCIPQVKERNEEQEKGVDITNGLGTKAPVEVVSEATDLESVLRQTAVNLDGEGNIIGDEDNFDFQFRKPTDSVEGEEDRQTQYHGVSQSEAEKPSFNSYLIQTESPPSVASDAVLVTIPSESETDTEQQKDSNRIASEQPETEGKKIVIGSRKSYNPAFVAAQSKFKELSSPTTSSMSINSTNKDIGVEVKPDSLLSPGDSQTKTIDDSENSISHDPSIHLGSLEVGSELYSSPTTDAPDRSEIEGGENEIESEVAEQAISHLDSTRDNPSTLENLAAKDPVLVRSEIAGGDNEIELNVAEETISDLDSTCDNPSTLENPAAKNPVLVGSGIGGGENEIESVVVEEAISDLDSTSNNPSILENLDAKNPVLVEPGKLDILGGTDSVVNLDSQQPERSASDVQIQHDTAIDQPPYRSSPEGSPGSDVTFPESHRTPSSQVTNKAKRKELSKSDNTQNRKSKSADKRSPSNPNHDSGARNSVEKLPKDSKSGKRRNSFGSAKTDHADQEPRESSSSSSLPSYMQATQSARAKAHTSNSPRSSPDAQDNDIYIKKRHSLPSANGKQGSPRMLSTSPQAHHVAKGDHTNPPRERWQR